MAKTAIRATIVVVTLVVAAYIAYIALTGTSIHTARDATLAVAVLLAGLLALKLFEE